MRDGPGLQRAETSGEMRRAGAGLTEKAAHDVAAAASATHRRMILRHRPWVFRVSLDQVDQVKKNMFAFRALREA